MARNTESASFPLRPFNPHHPMNRLFRCLLVALTLVGNVVILTKRVPKPASQVLEQVAPAAVPVSTTCTPNPVAKS